MKYYAYVMEGGGIKCLEARGVAALVAENHPERLRQIGRIGCKGSLYYEVGEVLKPNLVRSIEVHSTRTFSTSHRVQIQMLKRLCFSRDGWSRF